MLPRLNVEAQFAACATAASATATWLSTAGDLALQLFGVPLPVVLAAVTGACAARVFAPPATYARAALFSAVSAGAGVFGAQLVLWLVSAWMEKPPPNGAIGGLALVVAFLGPRVAPILWEKGGAAVGRWLDGIKGGA